MNLNPPEKTKPEPLGRFPTGLQRRREACAEMWMPPLSGLLGSAPRDSPFSPNAEQISPMCHGRTRDSKVWSEPFCTCLPSLILRYKQVTTTYRFFSLQLSQTRTSLHSPVTAEVLVTRLQLNHHKSPNQLPQLQDGPYKNGYCPQTPIYIFFLLKNNGQKTPLPKD